MLRHSVTLRTAAQGTLRHHVHAHVLVALVVTQRPCGVAHVHVVHVVATLPRARMLRPLACSLHECVHANAVSLLPTGTQACCVVPLQGGQHSMPAWNHWK